MYLALHRQKMFVALLAVTLVIRIPAIVVAGYAWGMNSAVLVLACSAAFNMVLWNACIAPAIGVSLGDFVRSTWRTFAAGAAMMLATAWLLAEWTPPLGYASCLSALGRRLSVGGHHADRRTVWALAFHRQARRRRGPFAADRSLWTAAPSCPFAIAYFTLSLPASARAPLRKD